MKKFSLFYAFLLSSLFMGGCSGNKKVNSSEKSIISSETVSSIMSSSSSSSEETEPGFCENADLYLRGSFNSWEADENYRLSVSESDSCIYIIKDVTLSSGDTFKIGDAAWKKYNYGFESLSNTAGFNDSGSGKIIVFLSGTYTISVNISSGSITVS